MSPRSAATYYGQFAGLVALGVAIAGAVSDAVEISEAIVALMALGALVPFVPAIGQLELQGLGWRLGLRFWEGHDAIGELPDLADQIVESIAAAGRER